MFYGHWNNNYELYHELLGNIYPISRPFGVVGCADLKLMGVHETHQDHIYAKRIIQGNY